MNADAFCPLAFKYSDTMTLLSWPILMGCNYNLINKPRIIHCFSNFPVHLQILIQNDRGSWGLRSCSSGKVPKTADAVNPFTALLAARSPPSGVQMAKANLMLIYHSNSPLFATVSFRRTRN